MAATALVCATATSPHAETRPDPEAVAAKAASTIRRALDKRSRVYTRRVAAAYRNRTPSWIEQWIRPSTRTGRTGHHYLRKLVEREAAELATLQVELAAARWAAAELGGEATARPEPRAVMEPPVAGAAVRGFGPYRHPGTDIELVHRGITYAVEEGAPVTAIATGRVRYVGPVRGLGACVITDVAAARVFAVVCGVGEVSVGVGDRLARGGAIGVATSREVYIEVRGRGGLRAPAVDPASWMVPPPSASVGAPQ